MADSITLDQLVLIHLSDIHFRREKNGIFDLDAGVRNELVLDATRLAIKIGHIDGILITGDVAFSGKAHEYEDASEWIISLCLKVGCPTENIWVIPGNHDVDRATIAASEILKIIHDDLRPTNPDYVDSKLKRWLLDPQAKELMFTPIENFNAFAQRFGCQSDSSNVYWQHDFTLNDSSILRMRGINSSLASGPTDNLQDRKLVVGSFQANLLREAGVTYMALCHHPCDWAIDNDTVTDLLDNLAAIQLFGHKHRQRFREIGTKGICIAAGAVQPARDESNWQPRYNIMAIDVQATGSERYLRLMLWPRLWQNSMVGFTAEVGEEVSESKTFKLSLSPWTNTNLDAVSLSHVVESNTKPTDTKPEVGLVQEQKEHPAVSGVGKRHFVDKERRLMYRFFGLSYAQIIKIAARLDLLSDEDAGMKDTERFQRFYKRARERDQLDYLWTEVEERYGDSSSRENPFAKLVEAEVQ